MHTQVAALVSPISLILAKLEFIISDGYCGQVNGEKTAHGCTITVCGNGEALVGTFCGRGPCNIFGCDCEGGCLHGHYGESFLQRNRRHNIQLMRTQMITTSSVDAVTGIFSKSRLSQSNQSVHHDASGSSFFSAPRDPLLANFGGSSAECCTTMAKLDFTINDGSCGKVNGERTDYGCTITVCGNGEALVGTYCGRGPCNIFGCACKGGCLHGQYGESFLQRNRRHNVKLMRTQMRKAGLF
ncbi:uncharacterized protein LOC108101629 [Drosophila ficusphila]|uniref:uncharacterized protein LOC108101629 n=1 Tax=Drosophila ficusphila TaxID=30025 RepID=UPI001C895EE2|nr:uncharacterized protein LOC108101629 [Drosophila ficusphila]